MGGTRTLAVVDLESLLTCITAVLYNLTKTLSRVLSLPLVLHHSLAPSLKRVNLRDPDSHKYDSVPPEVAFAAASVIVLKMVYGLDGTPRYGIVLAGVVVYLLISS